MPLVYIASAMPATVREKIKENKALFFRARSDYDEETAHESYLNPEPGFQSGPGDTVDAD